MPGVKVRVRGTATRVESDSVPGWVDDVELPVIDQG